MDNHSEHEREAKIIRLMQALNWAAVYSVHIKGISELGKMAERVLCDLEEIEVEYMNRFYEGNSQEKVPF